MSILNTVLAHACFHFYLYHTTMIGIVPPYIILNINSSVMLQCSSAIEEPLNIHNYHRNRSQPPS